ncbi:MAG: hypothetical protein ABF290_08150, partial [Thiogranum sp.]
YLRMELQSALEGSDATRQFFENRWRPFTDFIEFSLKELAAQHGLATVNGRVAAMAFQGMIREALYSKCIYRTPRYRELNLYELCDHLIELFFNAIGYVEPEK